MSTDVPDLKSNANGDASAGKVLVAEDDVVYRRALERLLTGQGYRVETVIDGAQALDRARLAEAPRLLILDWMMPGLQGPEICRKVREACGERYQYILLLTARNTPQDIVEGLEAGADDYLVKPFNAHELLARVRVGERMLLLHERLVTAQENLRFQAKHDGLTSLWNRKAVFELLAAEIQRAARKRTPLSVFLVDIDHFKQVNDRCGHLAGDAILQEVSSRLNAAVRPYDVIGRYGGEEFIIAAADLQPRAAKRLAERLRTSVSSTSIQSACTPVTVTVSIGVATASAAADVALEKLVQAADEAMYRAKRNGRNCVESVQLRKSEGTFAAPSPDIAIHELPTEASAFESSPPAL